MQSLITINQLLKMLIDEAYKFDFLGYQKLLSEKAKITQEIKRKRFVLTLLRRNNAIPAAFELQTKILPSQIKVISYYTERLSRIERILNIMRKGEGRISKDYSNEYQSLINLLQVLVDAGRSDIIGILELQQGALNEQNYRFYLSLIKKEMNILKKIAKSASKFEIGIEEKVRKQRIPFKRLSIRMKTVLLTKLVVLIVILPMFLSISGSESNPNRGTFAPWLYSVENCVYALKIGRIYIPDKSGKFGIRGEKDLMGAVAHYLANDLEYELSIEKDFEAETGLKVFGEYSWEDLISTKKFLQNTWGLNNIAEYLKVPAITFFPEDAAIYGESTENRCSRISVGYGGFSHWSAGIVVLNSSTLSNIEFISSANKPIRYTLERVLAHEITHSHHQKISERSKNFYKEWNTIKGGYAREYGTKSQFEDVATVTEEAVLSFLDGRDPGTIVPFDGNREAFRAKLKLLKKYGFFPPALMVY